MVVVSHLQHVTAHGSESSFLDPRASALATKQTVIPTLWQHHARGERSLFPRLGTWIDDSLRRWEANLRSWYRTEQRWEALFRSWYRSECNPINQWRDSEEERIYRFFDDERFGSPPIIENGTGGTLTNVASWLGGLFGGAEEEEVWREADGWGVTNESRGGSWLGMGGARGLGGASSWWK